MENFIPLSVPNLIGNADKYVSNAISTSWVSTGGSYITDFENNIAKYVSVQNAVAVQSGTAGLHLSLLALGVEANDEVIVPTLTFIAAVNPVKYCGAYPIFMDCDDSLCLDANKLKTFCEEECFFDGKTLINKKTNRKIKVVVAVHVFGALCDMEKILEIADKFNLKVLEDSTEALGTKYTSGKFKNCFAGTLGDIGVYSFNGNKIITTGGGGMIVSNNKTLSDRCRYLSTQAKNDVVYFIHNEIGYNYRMTNLQAALGLSQLEVLDKFIEIKNNNYDLYNKLGIKLLAFNDNIRSNKWFYSVVTKSSKDRDDLIKYLNTKAIQSRPIWTLIHTLPMYKNEYSYKIEKAIYYQDKIVNIPCSTNLSNCDINRVAKELKNYGC